MSFRRFSRRCGAFLVLVAASAGAAGAQELRLEPVFPTPNSSLYMGAVGDTIPTVAVRVVDRQGKAVAGVRVRFQSGLAKRPGVAPVRETALTGPGGVARIPVLVQGPPGDHAILASAVDGAAAPTEIPFMVLKRSWFGFLLVGIGGGLALFLYGMRLIGRGLEKAAGGKLRELLASVTGSRLRSLAFGTISTLMVQSSSASTVLLVSFASAGLVSVEQGLAAAIGAAVGATFTVQLIAFRISDFALLLVAAGVPLTMSRGLKRRVGGAVLGFGLIFYGLQIMSEAMGPLKGMPAVIEFFVHAARDPIPALVVATVFTAVTQASAATIGLVLGLAFQGILSLEAAIPFVLGANVGTATTALLASVTSNTAGKRVAWAHAAFRLMSVLIALPFLGALADVAQRLSQDLPRQVAHVHTLLNVAAAAVFFPLIPAADRLFRALVPESVEKPEFGPESLDPRFHEQPSIALASALREVLRMGQLVIGMLGDVKDSLRRDDTELADSIRARDDQVDRLDEAITRYLSELSTEYLSEAQSARVLDLLFLTKDLELIADIVSKGLVPGLLRKKQEEDLHFSEEGFREILQFHDRVREIVEIAVASITTWDGALAREVLERKRDLGKLERRFQLEHLARLQAGNPQTHATTAVHLDAITDLKRIASHTKRIAHVVLGNVHDLPEDPSEVRGSEI